MRSLALLALVLPLGCGGGDGGGSDGGGSAADADPTAPDSGGGGPDAALGAWELLLQGDWSLPAGDEGYYCVRATVPETVYVGAFRPIIPLGTHHTVLTIDDGGGADGVFPCNAGENGQNMIYGSGVGSPEFTFPAGVAIKLDAGQKLLLNLHLYNTGETTLTGTSGTEFRRVDPALVVNEAELILMGPTFGLTIPPGTSTQSGGCTMDADVTLFASAPHMHKLGTHLKATAVSGGTSTVLFDEDYSFDDQTFYWVEPMVQVQSGDRVNVECTYNNTTGGVVTFGDSSDAEMCFASTYRYPKQGSNFICTF